MKYRVNFKVSTTYQVDVECDKYADVESAGILQLKKKYGACSSDLYEVENIEELEVEDGK